MNSYIAAAILAYTGLVAAAPYGNLTTKRQGSQVCIQFDPQVTSYYTNTGVWGTDSAQITGQICVPVDDSAGGAMYIGPEPNPGAGSTKLECFFPSSGQSNCDVSLVDGFSLAVSCTSPDISNTIGGPRDLFNYNGNVCPDKVGPNCINTAGGGTDQSAVDGFFQPAIYDGNNYCIFANCGQDYYFTATDGISCAVSGSDT